MTGGYFLLHRKLIENPIWTTMAPSALKVMLGFLIKANYQPATWYDGATEIQIPRGSFVTTVPMMAKFCHVSPKQARAAFEHLERAKFASYTRADGRAHGRAGGLTMVTVCNYDAYQSREAVEGTRLGKPLGVGKGSKVINNKKNTPPSPSDDGANGDLLHLPFDTLDELPKVKSTTKPAGRNGSGPAATLATVARAIHARHPEADGRRDCGVGMVERKLTAILRRNKIPAERHDDYLRRIDSNHAAICESDQWTKDDGMFAKGLKNWLAPNEERYAVELNGAAAIVPAGRMMA